MTLRCATPRARSTGGGAITYVLDRASIYGASGCGMLRDLAASRSRQNLTLAWAEAVRSEQPAWAPLADPFSGSCCDMGGDYAQVYKRCPVWRRCQHVGRECRQLSDRFGCFGHRLMAFYPASGQGSPRDRPHLLSEKPCLRYRRRRRTGSPGGRIARTRPAGHAALEYRR